MAKPKSLLTNVGVVIPYKDLVSLLNAAAELEDCHKQIRSMRAEISALRYMFTELTEKYAEYQD